MDYCNDCGEQINGFDYGVGFNSQCTPCNDKEELRCLQNIKIKLEIKKLKNESTLPNKN